MTLGTHNLKLFCPTRWTVRTGTINAEISTTDRDEYAMKANVFLHQMNLCLQDAARVCTPTRDCLHLVMELVQLIKWSPKRSSLFEQLKTEMTPGTHDLKPFCLTRWTVRTGTINAEISTTDRDDVFFTPNGKILYIFWAKARACSNQCC